MTTTGVENPPVVVAAAEVQERLLENAIDEARRLNAPLRVVTCWEPVNGRSESTDATSGEACFGDVSSLLHKLASDASTEIRSFVVARAPELSVTYTVEQGDPFDILQAEAGRAREVLVGADGDLPRYMFVFRGAVTRRLAATSRQPIVIVPERSRHEGGDVVLLLPDWAPDALLYALDAAHARGVVLHVVHESDGPGSRADQRWKDRCYLLDTHRSLFPDVEVTVDTTPRGGLVEAAGNVNARTSLIVVGSQPRSHRWWFLDRSIAGKLAGRTVVPLALIPPRPTGHSGHAR